ncbi:hypothetical protein [Coleofasciculus sp. E2-BRE-01]
MSDPIQVMLWFRIGAIARLRREHVRTQNVLVGWVERKRYLTPYLGF